MKNTSTYVCLLNRPVCPQKTLDYDSLLEVMPAARVERLRLIGQHTNDQNEDCLFLNIYVPARGRYNIHLHTGWNETSLLNGKVLDFTMDVHQLIEHENNIPPWQATFDRDSQNRS